VTKKGKRPIKDFVEFGGGGWLESRGDTSKSGLHSITKTTEDQIGWRGEGGKWVRGGGQGVGIHRTRYTILGSKKKKKKKKKACNECPKGGR